MGKRVREKCGTCGRPADVKDKSVFLCAACYKEYKELEAIRNGANNTRFRDLLR